MMWRSLEAFWKADRGAALVECAVILPVFLALVGGIYEFGFYLYQEQLITSGVRDAARYMSLTADPNSSSGQMEAKNLAVTGSIDGGTPRVAGWNTSDVSIAVDSIDNSDGTYSGGATIQVVIVSTSFLDPSLGFFGLLGLAKPTISVSHQERFIGDSARAQE